MYPTNPAGSLCTASVCEKKEEKKRETEEKTKKTLASISDFPPCQLKSIAPRVGRLALRGERHRVGLHLLRAGRAQVREPHQGLPRRGHAQGPPPEANLAKLEKV